MSLASLRYLIFIFLLTVPVVLMAQENQFQIISADSERVFSVPSDLQSRLRLQPSGPETKSLVRSWLVSVGYLDASVDSVVSAQAQSSIFVSVGNEYILNDLVVSEAENEGVNDRIILNTSQFEQQVFTQKLTKEISDCVLSVYEQIGFYLAEFRIIALSKNPENSSVSIEATVVPGDRIRIQGIRFQGVERNSESYLRRVAGIAGDQILTPGLMGRGRQNLVNSGLFDDVSVGELIFIDDLPYLLYEVSEQQLNFFDGLIGYQPDPSGSASIAGYGDILLRNTVADGNIIDLRFEQLQPLVSKLDLNIEQQFLGGLPLDIGAGLNFTQQDSSYLVRNFRLTSGYRLFPGFRISAHVRAERSSVTQTDIQSSAIDSRANFYGVGFQIRNVNRYIVPTKGFEGTVLLERGRRFINDDRFQSVTGRSFSQTILQSSARGFIPLGNRPVLVPMVQAMFLESPDYLVTDLFRFGGAESFRGFREDQFRGSSVIWGELEGRYMLQQNSYLFMFGAYGFYQRPRLLNEVDDELAFNDSLSSFGFGLAFETQLGIIKFSYAVSPNENLSNGNVHVGISTGL